MSTAQDVGSLVALYAEMTMDPDDGVCRLDLVTILIMGVHQGCVLVWSGARLLFSML